MHNAPSVLYPLGRSRFPGLLLLVLWMAGAGVFVFWRQSAAGFDWRQSTVLVALVLSGVTAGLGWKNSPIGQLRWDGQAWRWEGADGQAASPARELSVAFDLQHMLLLKLTIHDSGVKWLWVERRALPERWLDLRRAVYSRRKASLLLPDSLVAVSSVDLLGDSRPPRPYP